MTKKTISVAEIRRLMKEGTPMVMGTELIQAFYDYGIEAQKITMEMNSKYHTHEQVRKLFAKLTAGKVDESCLIIPPFYTEFGKNTKIGKEVFINSCCHFQDNGGIEIGDGTMLGCRVIITTLNHDINPKTRFNATPKPVKIGKKV